MLTLEFQGGCSICSVPRVVKGTLVGGAEENVLEVELMMYRV